MRSGLLADDLTGALDGGLQLFRNGHPVTVYFPWANPAELTDSSGFTVLDTESRNVDADEARKRTKRALSLLDRLGLPLVYKKVDSTLRGNPGVEIAAVLESASFDAVLVTPALPKLGRTVKEGVLLLDEVPISETEFGSDPLAPVYTSKVSELIQQGTTLECRTVPGETFSGIHGRLDDFLESLFSPKPVVLIADSENDEDLQAISKFAVGCGRRLLPCGSAGLLEFIAGDMDSAPFGKQAESEKVKPSRGPVFIVSASMSEVSRRQIENAVDSGTAHRVRPANIGSTHEQGAAEESGRRILEILHDGKHVLLDAGGSREDLPANREEAAEQSNLILKSLSVTVSTVFGESGKNEIGGLVLVGGETAITVCRCLNAFGIRIAGESEPFVPSGTVIGGLAAGLGVITKAGGFGSDTVLSDACGYFSKYK